MYNLSKACTTIPINIFSIYICKAKKFCGNYFGFFINWFFLLFYGFKLCDLNIPDDVVPHPQVDDAILLILPQGEL